MQDMSWTAAARQYCYTKWHISQTLLVRKLPPALLWAAYCGVKATDNVFSKHHWMTLQTYSMSVNATSDVFTVRKWQALYPPDSTMPLCHCLKHFPLSSRSLGDFEHWIQARAYCATLTWKIYESDIVESCSTWSCNFMQLNTTQCLMQKPSFKIFWTQLRQVGARYSCDTLLSVTDSVRHCETLWEPL